MPRSEIFWNILKMRVLGKGESRGLYAPARHTWKTVCTVAHHRQVIRNRLRTHPKLCYNTSFIAHDIAPAIQLNDAGTHNTLSKIFIRSTDNYLTHLFILGRFNGSRSQRIVRLVVDHWPHHDAHRMQRIFENRKLSQQFLRHTFAGFVSWI